MSIGTTMSRQDRRKARKQNQHHKPLRKIPKANPWVLGLLAFLTVAFVVLYSVAHT